MAKIILINKQEYEVTNEEAKASYYAKLRKEYKCPIRDNLVLPCVNIKKIIFDCEQESGQADCMCDSCAF